jgi:nucleoside-diphosphate-sugar epimerase
LEEKLILVTGAGGFVGRNTVFHLTKNKINVKALVRKKNQLFKDERIEQIIWKDIFDINNNWDELLLNVDIVIHLIAKTHDLIEPSIESLEDFKKTNELITEKFLTESIARKVKKFIFISSVKVNGEFTLGNVKFGPDDQVKPATFYGITKLHAESMIEFLAKKYQIQSCIGRIFSYSHIFQKEPFLVPSLLKKIELLEDNQDLFVPNLDSMRDILDGETVVDILIELARGKHTGIFNVASGSGKSIGDIANELCVLQSRKLNIIGENFLKPNSYIADVSKLSNAIKIG